MTERKLLGLDLDETLVHTWDVPPTMSDAFLTKYLTTRMDCRLYAPTDLYPHRYVIQKRPHADDFLHEVTQLYDVFVWSASDRHYIDAVLAFFPQLHPVFVFDHWKCIYKVTTIYHEGIHDTETIKPLKKVFRRKTLIDGEKRRLHAPHNVIIVDNAPSTFQRNYGNAIHVVDYIGQEEDTELLHVLEILRKVAMSDHVRDGLEQWSRPPPMAWA